MVRKASAVHKASIRLIEEAFSLSETCYRYEAKLCDENADITDWLLRLMQSYKRLGVWSVLRVSEEHEGSRLES